MDSIHGKALLKMGLIVAPSCNDCHGVHDIKRSVDRDSPIHHANISKTCGACHVTVEEIYNASVHGQLLRKRAKPVPSAPTATAPTRSNRRSTATSRWPATGAAASAMKTG
jgi:hypothetical protein